MSEDTVHEKIDAVQGDVESYQESLVFRGAELWLQAISVQLLALQIEAHNGAVNLPELERAEQILADHRQGWLQRVLPVETTVIETQ